jgi:drug/metabolite transporter (DMT)-like permease
VTADAVPAGVLPASRERLRGIVAMLFAVASFAAMDAALKGLATQYPPMQVSFLRAVASLPFVLAATAWSGAWRELRMQRWGLQIARGFLGIGMLWGFVYAVAELSLANVYAVYLCAPLVVAALSWPLLGERVTPRRWVAIALGLMGVLVALRPSGTGLVSLAGIAALASAGCYALSAVTIRVLGRTDSSRSMVFWFLCAVAVGSGLLALPDWQAVDRGHLAMLAFIGLAGALGQFFITTAFRHAPAATVAPFEYTALLWGIGLDWAIWQVLPEVAVLLGGAIVIASGLYVIWDERRAYFSPDAPHP